MTPEAALKAGLAMLLAAALLLFAGDFAWFEYRIRNAKPNDPLETMTFYYATDIKGSKTEVFFDQPQTATSVHSVFPHGGYKPCWRFSRSGIQRISLMILGCGEMIERDYFAGWPELGKGRVLGADAETAIDLAPFLPTERTAKK